MAALSQTLLAVGGPASGHVATVVLVDGAFEVSYLRLGPPLTADHESGVIRWH